MQFSLQTLMLVFVVVAAAVVLCGPGGLLLAAVVLVSARHIRLAKNRFNAWAMVLLVWFLGVCLAGLFVPPGIHSREGARRTQCTNNEKIIAIALMRYDADHGHLPPAYIADANGKPMHSWRVLILPYLDRRDIYEAYDFKEPWNGPHNLKLASIKLPDFFSCPNHTGNQKCTNYVAVVGPQTVWPGEKTSSTSEVAAGDGIAETVLLMELPNSDINWMEPRDLSFDELCNKMTPQKRAEVFDAHKGSSVVSFVDGHYECLDEPFLQKNIKALLTKNGGEKIDFDDHSGPGYRGYRTGDAVGPVVSVGSMILLIVIMAATTLLIIYRPRPKTDSGQGIREEEDSRTVESLKPKVDPTAKSENSIQESRDP